MATLTNEESDQMSRLLNKLGLLAGKVYSLEDLRALIIPPPEDKKWVKVREDENYMIYESTSHVKEMETLMKWTMKQALPEMSEANCWDLPLVHTKDVLNKEEESAQKEEEWIAVNRRGKERRNRGARAGRIDGRNDGRNQGRNEGRNQGRKEGRNQGRNETRNQGRGFGLWNKVGFRDGKMK